MRAAADETRGNRRAADVETGRGVNAAGAQAWRSPGAMAKVVAPQRAARQALRRRGASVNVVRRAGMPDAYAVAAVAPDRIAAAPAVPAIRAAPTVISIPLIAAPIPTRAVPAVVVPTIVGVIEGIILDCLRWR